MRATAGGVNVGGYEWLPCIAVSPVPSITIGKDAMVAQYDAKFGKFVLRLDQAEFGNLNWRNLIWDGASVRMFIGDDGAPFASYTQEIEGFCGPASLDGINLEMEIFGPEASLAQDLLTLTYAGTGGAEGRAELKGKLKPFAIGECINVEPILIDPAYRVYQYHGYGETQDVLAIYENAVKIDGLVPSIVETYAALIAPTLQPDQWLKCPKLGLFRMGGNASGKLTADVRGAKDGTTYVSTISAIVPSLIKRAGVPAAKINQTSLNKFSGRSWSYYTAEQASIGDVARDALFQANGNLFADGQGVWRACDQSQTATVIDLIRGDNVEEIRRTGENPQVWNLKVGYDRVWSKHSTSEISPAIKEAQEAADAAKAAADEAQDAADAAQADATLIKNRVATISDDGWLDRSEKPQIIQLFQQITLENNKWLTESARTAVQPPVTAERTALLTAYNALAAFLNGLTPAYTDTTQDTPVDRVTMNARFGDWADKLVTLTAALAKRTEYVGGEPAANIVTAYNNFNSRNDRLATAVPAPTFATDGSAIDHTLNTDGSANITVKWAWAGNNEDIDGFRLVMRSSAVSAAYTFGASVGEEQAVELPADRRTFIASGVPANLYYTFFVEAYRTVDKDVAASGVIKSAAVKSTRSDENPYRPSATVVFTGSIGDNTVIGSTTAANLAALAQGAVQIDNTAPAQTAGVTINSEVIVDNTGAQIARMTVNWTASAATDLAAYDIAIAEGASSTNFVEYRAGATATSYLVSPVAAGLVYRARVRAVDNSDNRGAWSTIVNHTAAKDTVAPAAPTSLTTDASFERIQINWTNPTASDLDRVEIYENTTNSSGTATKIDTVSATSATVQSYGRGGLAHGSLRYYWLKAVDTSGNASPFSAVVSATTAAGIDYTDFDPTLGMEVPRSVSSLPSVAGYTGPKLLLNSTDGQLYRLSGGAWTLEVKAPNITGQIVNSQIGDNAISAAKIAAGVIDATKMASGLRVPLVVAGTTVAALPSSGVSIGQTAILSGDASATIYRWTGSAWTADVPTTNLVGTINTAQLASGAVDATKMAAGLRVPLVVTGSTVAALPTTGVSVGQQAVLSGDASATIYRWTGSAWTKAIAAVDVAGALAAANIPGLDASKITSGQFGSSLIADGAINATKLADQSLTLAKFPTNLRPLEVVSGALPAPGTVNRVVVKDGKIVRDTGTAWTSEVPTEDLIGQIVGAQIASSSITATKLSIGDSSNMFGDPDMVDAAYYTSTVPVTLVNTGLATTSQRRLTIGATVDAVDVLGGAIPVQIGATYFASARGYRASGTGSVPVELAIKWYSMDAGGALTELSETIIQQVALTNSTIRTMSGQATAPADARRARFVFRKIATATAFSVSYMEPLMQRAASAALIQPGALDITHLASGLTTIEIVAALPATGNFVGRTVYLTTDNKPYRYDGATWSKTVDAVDIAGQLATAQIAVGAVTATQIASGAVTALKVADAAITNLKLADAAVTSTKLVDNAVTTAKINANAVTVNELASGAVTAAKIAPAAVTQAAIGDGVINAAKFAANIAPVEIVAALPTTGNYQGRQVHLTTDNKTYRHTGSAWTSTVPATDVTGTLTDAQLSAISAAKLTGLIVGTQISDNAISTPKLLAGAISADKLATGSVITSKIASGAITANEIASGAVTTSKLLAGSVTAAIIAANTITAGQIAVGAIGADQIAANAIVASKIAIGDTTNMIPDDQWRDLDGSWALDGPNSPYVALASTVWTGGRALRIPAITAAVSGRFGAAWSSSIPVTPGQTLAVGLNIDPSSTAAASSAYARLWWFEGDGVTPANGGIGTTIANHAASTNADLSFSTIVTVPVGATIAKLQLVRSGTDGTTEGGHINFHSVYVRKAMSGELIVDGAITASKVGANAITANAIAADAVTATAIAAGSITTQKLAVGAVTAETIAAAAITTLKLASGAVTANEIASNAITADKVSAGAINAGHIASNAITTKQLAITDFTNLIPNSSFSSGLSGWTPYGGTITPYTGTEGQGLLITKGASTAEAGVRMEDWTSTTFSNTITITPGEELRVKCSVTRKAGSSGGNCGIYINWLDKDGVRTGNSINGVTSSTPLNTTVEVNGSWTVPLGAVACRWQAYYGSSGSSANGSVAVTNIAVRRMNAGEMIVDGAITANKLTAGAVEADKLAANSVSADKIVSGSITTPKLATGAVTAETIAAAAITAEKIATNAITAEKLDVGAVVAGTIAAAAVNSAEIAAGAISADKIAANAVVADKIAANAIGADKLAANSVTAIKIASGAILTDKLAANSVTAAQIAAGSIAATHIQTNVISASKLIIGDTTNMVPDDQFNEFGVSWTVWGPNNAPYVITGNSGFNAPSGRAIRLPSSVAADSSGVFGGINGAKFAVNPALQYSVGATIDPSSTSATSSARVQIVWYTAADVISPTRNNDVIADFVTSTNSGQTYSVTVTPPFDAAFGFVQIWRRGVIGATEAGSVNVHSIYVRRAISGELIVDGAITATKMAANSIAAGSIIAGAITTEKIASNAVTANELAANSVSAGKIVAGAVGATQIAANAITASKVNIGDTSNMVPDPALIDTGSWTGSAYTLSTTTSAFASSNYLRILSSAAAPQQVRSAPIPVEKSTEYHVSIMPFTSSNGTATATASVEWYSDIAATNLISTQQIGSSTTTTQTAVSINLTAPATARRAVILLARSAATSNTGEARFANPIMRRAIAGQLIVDGAISADKIATNSVTSDKVAANAISADKISANSITADKIAANSIDAGKVIAGAIGTAQLAALAITTDKLAAGSVVATKLAIGDTSNMFTDPDMVDISAYGWSHQLTLGPVDGIDIASRNWGFCASSTSQQDVYGSYIPVEAGKQYFVSTWAGVNAGSTTVQLYIEWHTITSGVTTWQAATGIGGTTTSGIISAQLTAPAGSRYARFLWRKLASASASQMVFASPIMRRAASGELIVDGAISATKIAAGAVEADKLAANSVTATAIAAGSVVAGKLASDSVTANAILGGTITGAKIAGDQIGAGHLQANSITAAKIAAGAITSTSITVNTLNGDRISTGTLTADKLVVTAGGIVHGATSLPVGIQVGAGGTTIGAINDGTAKYRTTGTPTTNPSPTSTSVTANSNGTRNVVVNWAAYTQGARQADFLILFWKKGTTAPTANDSSVNLNVNTAGASYYIFEGINPADQLSVGIAAARRTENGLEIGSIVTHSSWTNIATATVNFTGNLNGTAASTVVSNAATGAQDPATRINGGSTTILPGKILISGSTYLSNWAKGGDDTRIDGGAISANTISANKLTVGMRGVTFDGLDFITNRVNQVNWGGGIVNYVNDSGVLVASSISAGSATWDGANRLYIWWNKGSGGLNTGTTWFNNNDDVLVAVYYGGININVTMGRTIIDGDYIQTGTIQANRLNVAQLSAITADVGTVQAGILRNAAGTTKLDLNGSTLVFNNGSYMTVKGIGFGSTNQFLEWSGPYQSALSGCTESNAISFLKTNGQAYYAGGIIAGTLKSSVANASTGTTATATTGTIGSNGNSVSVNGSYTMRATMTATYPSTTTGRNDYDTAISTFGSATSGDGGFTHQGTKSNNPSSGFTMNVKRDGSTLGTLTTLNGSISIEGLRPVIGDAGGSITYTYDFWAAITSSDPTVNTASRSYSADFTRSYSFGSATIQSQRISVTSTEW